MPDLSQRAGRLSNSKVVRRMELARRWIRRRLWRRHWKRLWMHALETAALWQKLRILFVRLLRIRKGDLHLSHVQNFLLETLFFPYHLNSMQTFHDQLICHFQGCQYYQFFLSCQCLLFLCNNHKQINKQIIWQTCIPQSFTATFPGAGGIYVPWLSILYIARPHFVVEKRPRGVNTHAPAFLPAIGVIRWLELLWETKRGDGETAGKVLIIKFMHFWWLANTSKPELHYSFI